MATLDEMRNRFRVGSPEIQAVSAELRDVLAEAVEATFDSLMTVLRSRPVLLAALEKDPDTTLRLLAGGDVGRAWRERANAEHQARLIETAKVETARRRERRARVPTDGAAWLRKQLSTLNVEPQGRD